MRKFIIKEVVKNCIKISKNLQNRKYPFLLKEINTFCVKNVTELVLFLVLLKSMTNVYQSD